MKLFLKITLLTIILFLTGSCLDYRGRMMRKAAKKAREGVITRQQYDSIVSTFYTIKAENLSNKGDLVKFKGVYIDKYLEYDKTNYYYSIIKLDTLGNIYRSQKLNFPPSNETLKNLYNTKHRYTILEDELLFETIQINAGDMRTHNIIHYAKIKGDTLEFYKNVDILAGSFNSIERYLYVDSLTENMEYPPKSLPINNK